MRQLHGIMLWRSLMIWRLEKSPSFGSMDLVAAAAFTLGTFFVVGSAHAKGERDPLCSMFRGEVIGTKNDKPVLATCQFIRKAEAVYANVNLSPFHNMVNAVNINAARPFEEFLAAPQNQEYRQRCKQDVDLKPGAAGSYTCVALGVPFRFFLNGKHQIIKLVITIRSDGKAVGLIGPFLQQLFKNAPAAVINQPNQTFILLVWQAEAARFNQIARPGESYRVEGGSFIVEIANLAIKH